MNIVLVMASKQSCSGSYRFKTTSSYLRADATWKCFRNPATQLTQFIMVEHVLHTADWLIIFR